MPAVTPLPTPPSTSNPSTFNALADAFIAALPTLVTEINALLAGAPSVGNATTLLDKTWAIPDPIGSTTPSTAEFTVLEHLTRCASYKWDTWVPSDVAGTLTTAPSTGTAVAATDFMTLANSSGTVTITFVKDGKYLINALAWMEAAAAVTLRSIVLNWGGTATRNVTDPGTIQANSTGSVNTGSESFLVSATAGQTLTLQPRGGLTQGGGTEANYVFSANVVATYMGG